MSASGAALTHWYRLPAAQRERQHHERNPIDRNPGEEEENNAESYHLRFPPRFSLFA